jgi:hypothetical protein
MTKKLHVKLGPDAKDAAVSVKLDDGTLHRLDRVLSITLHATSNDQVPPTVSMVMWSPDFDAEIPISEDLAKAILVADVNRTLSFIDDKEAGALRTLLAELGGIYAGMSSQTPWSIYRPGLDALTKIVTELSRREEVLF